MTAPSDVDMGYIVGVDIGGTFTDAVILDAQGRVFYDKAHSTPENPALGAIEALRNAVDSAGLEISDVLRSCRSFAHGTTVGTNALIEGRGSRVGLMTTRGFEDTLLIGRGPMGKNMGVPLSQAMDFTHNERPDPIVERAAIVGIRERIDLDGNVVAGLCEDDVRSGMDRLRAMGIESVAISLLWSFRNPAHERRVAEIVRELEPAFDVSLSSEIAPMIGEFERTTTTVVNAFVAPVMSRYVDDLAERLAGDGLGFPLQLMTSSGGLIFPADVPANGVRLINGGPVGGLVAARRLGEALGHADVITADMGGTSFDVGLIHRGSIQREPSVYVSQGMPVLVDAARVVTIGAGGGSIAASDGKRLTVGPRSAGAEPGPACYGRGGDEPTVTDALLVLGFLEASRFFGGREQLDAEAAERAIRSRVASPLGLSVQEAAAGIYEIVTARMRDLIRQMTVESGFDTRGFALMAYGGAAPLHACGFSERLGLREVIVPSTSAVFSALGCALSDVRYARARSAPTLLSPRQDVVDEGEAVLADLEAQALTDMASTGHAPEAVALRRLLDVRYAGQMTEISVALPAPLTGPRVRAAFEQAYRERYGEGTTRAQSAIEIITYRVEATATFGHPGLREEAVTAASAEPYRQGQRPIFLRHLGVVDAAVYDGDAIRAGCELEGPALIERRDTTVWVAPGQSARIDGFGNVRIQLAN